MRPFAVVLQVLGLLVLSAGCWLLAGWLGFVMLGLSLLAVGVAVELEARSRDVG